ncbi:MAG: PEP-CTERM sorting domain-containing protein [Phycisphaeraceae bacterium]|nr:PEP-CTERM sorting domain-containing protein [Phycisphaeraceae bacterium]
MRSTTSVLTAMALAVAAGANISSAALLYGGGTETASRFNPGAGAITYMNCFTAVTPAQTQLVVTNVVVGIRRLTVSGSLVDVGINIYAAQMTWDGTTLGRGANHLIYSQASLGGGAATITQLVNTGPISSPAINLELATNPGLGGWWIGVEFTGVNAGDANNGWRVTNAPTTGASINGFGIYNNAGSGVFQALFGFGTPAGSSPSRFLTNVEGNLVPAPGSLALIGLGGLVAARRRRA